MEEDSGFCGRLDMMQYFFSERNYNIGIGTLSIIYALLLNETCAVSFCPYNDYISFLDQRKGRL